MSAGTNAQASTFVFEVSWEVCNKVGGIYTVLATKAAEMVARYGDQYVLIGPKIWQQDQVGGIAEFIPDEHSEALISTMAQVGIDISCGRWNIPGNPRCILVDFSSAYKSKDTILEELWLSHQVDSLTGSWDYVEPALFGYTAGQVIQRFAGIYAEDQEVVGHWHEWMVGSGMLYLKNAVPDIASVFTTHATILGRSIASSGESLEEALETLDPLARASSLNIRAKYSLEKALIQAADCLTTVSSTTADEVFGIYGRRADVLLPNGLGAEFPDPNLTKPDHVATVRGELFSLAETMAAKSFDRHKTRLILTSGRYEYINKGVNLLLDVLASFEKKAASLDQDWVVFFCFPTDHGEAHKELLDALKANRHLEKPLLTTHKLNQEQSDPLCQQCHQLGLANSPENRVTIVFAPVYLSGQDGVFNRSYYELLPAFDLSVFPSHYEPWGYTPLESIGLGVPTITTDLAGFGQWAAAKLTANDAATFVLSRAKTSYQEAVTTLTDHFAKLAALDGKTWQRLKEASFGLAKEASWENFATFYFAAHQGALLTKNKRAPHAGKRFRHVPAAAKPSFRSAPPVAQDVSTICMRPFTVKNRIPQRLQALEHLAHNLWWSWYPPAEALFKALDSQAWEACHHNPVKLLDTLPQATLDRAANDKQFQQLFDQVMEAFSTYQSARRDGENPEIAYFCMEYGLHECLALYSGGLGVLAGDHLKAASDLDLPMIAVGLAYREGYFRQKFDVTGYQIDEPMQLDFSSLPMKLLRNKDGSPVKIKILFPGHKLTIGAWEVQVGSIRLLLLDTDLPENVAQDRAITSSLYGGDQEKRLKQEMVLGIGGRNLLSELGMAPKVWHLNEGHASFLVLSRAADLMAQHRLDFHSALEYCRQTGVFTTHTPVPAGHDVFSEDLMRPFFSNYRHALHISWDQIMALGKYPKEPHSNAFSMTVLGMRGNSDVNGVSQLHGEVSQRNLVAMTPGHHWREVPVGAITNGVHLPTWLAPSFQAWFDKVLDSDWRTKTPEDAMWQKIRHLDKQKYREVRTQLKRGLLDRIRGQIMSIWERHRDDPALLNAILGNLKQEACIIGFARRFAPYKRATLLFRDLDVLARIVNNPQRPVIFMFAGKAHPADEMGKALIKEIYQISRKPEFQGRILLLENYDMELAKYLVRGCDIWLNTPTRPLEASGTSGMKAAMNGVVNVSVLDGWWVEGYNGENGWAIGEDRVFDQPDYQDDYDSQHLYSLLEDQVLPRYFQNGVPLSDAWLETSMAAMETSMAPFASHRMLTQYQQRYYGPASERATQLAQDQFEKVAQAANQKRKLRHLWDHLRVVDYQIEGLQDGTIHHGDSVAIQLKIHHPKLAVEDLQPQLVVGLKGDHGDLLNLDVMPLQHSEDAGNGASVWQTTYRPSLSGSKAFGIRVVPNLPLERGQVATDLAMIHWVH